MIAWIAAVLLAGQSPAALAGIYQTHQMEVGAMLELRKDGTFQYMLDYGSVSEVAEGRWTATRGIVHLDSDPLAKDVMIRMERSDAAFRDAQLTVDDGSLVMRRYDTTFTFDRDEP